MENESEHALTQLCTSEHGSDSEAETSNSDIVPRFLTQQSVLGIDSDSEPENSTPDSPPPPPSNNDIGQQVMEYRPHSRYENSTTTRLPTSSINYTRYCIGKLCTNSCY